MASILYSTNLLLMAIAVVIAIRSYRYLDTAARIFTWLLAANFLTEIFALVWRNGPNGNKPLYDYAEIIKVFLLCLYFTELLPRLKQNNRGIVLGIICSLLALSVPLFAVQFSFLSTYFLMLKGLLVITLAMITLVRLTRLDLQKGDRLSLHFCLTAALLTFWTLTSSGWFILNHYQQMDTTLVSLAGVVLLWVNLAFYLYILLVYYRLHKARS